MDILIVGTGMYVTGRGTQEYGTILPAITEWKRSGKPLDKVFLVGTNRNHSVEVLQKAKKLQSITGVQYDVEVFPKLEGIDNEAYLGVLNNLKNTACTIVAVPDHLHCKVATACIQRNFHTLVVKPLTPTVKEAQTLVSLAKKYNVYGAVEFHKRWDRQNRILRDEYRNGKLGVPLYTWTEYSQRKSIPSQVFRSWVEKTNIMQYLGVHYIDIIRFVTNAVPVRVMATGQKKWLKGQGLDVYDSIQSMIEWKTHDGHIFNQTLLVNWIDPENSSSMSDQKIKFVGTKGRYEGDQKERGVRLLYDDQVLQEPNPDFCRAYAVEDEKIAWEGYGIDSIISYLNDVSSIIDKKNVPQDFEGKRPTFSETVFSTAVIESMAKSIANQSSWETVNYS
ncbi:MAG: Gfo/Idh/MocA family oxidoreductase [Crocinitomicaceae bacterium]|jgi:D-galacturonate reductase|nr:Gfo/Idh/MocA family oxidoreductase [Crocinitomicaceae bacterium]